MGQRFYANPSTRFQYPNGAIGYGPGGSFDCLGRYAKVTNCPIAGTARRLTCYATGYADTFFSVPACTRVRGRYVSGFFTREDGSPVFVPHVRFRALFATDAEIDAGIDAEAERSRA